MPFRWIGLHIALEYTSECTKRLRVMGGIRGKMAKVRKGSELDVTERLSFIMRAKITYV